MNSNGLLILDDHPVYREALTEKLGADFATLGVHVASAASAQEGLEILSDPERRWLVLLDIQMPGLSGLALIKVFTSHPQVDQVVAITGLDEKIWELRAVNAGAKMFLSKNNTIQYIFRKLEKLLHDHDGKTAEPTIPQPTSLFRLTDRQRQVLCLIAQGHPNKIIAHFLEISEQTVKIHINQIFKELRVFNRTQAVLKAQRNNLI